MAAITVVFDDVDAAIVERYAHQEGKSIADFVRDAVFEKIELREDLAIFHAAIAKDDAANIVYNQVLSELRL